MLRTKPSIPLFAASWTSASHIAAVYENVFPTM